MFDELRRGDKSSLLCCVALLIYSSFYSSAQSLGSSRHTYHSTLWYSLLKCIPVSGKNRLWTASMMSLPTRLTSKKLSCRFISANTTSFCISYSKLLLFLIARLSTTSIMTILTIGSRQGKSGNGVETTQEKFYKRS
jgi:hypothetical protein